MNIATPKPRMSVPEFFAWAEKQPEGKRYELVDGEIVAMAPERARHNLVKFAVARALDDAVRAAKLPCTVFTDGMSVVINNHATREPDASVQCGVDTDLNSMILEAPLIVVEVVSPTSERSDKGIKLVDYFSVTSIQHYLIVFLEERAVIHHRRKNDGIETRIARPGEDITLEPPGFSVSVDALLGPLSISGKEVLQKT